MSTEERFKKTLKVFAICLLVGCALTFILSQFNGCSSSDPSPKPSTAQEWRWRVIDMEGDELDVGPIKAKIILDERNAFHAILYYNTAEDEMDRINLVSKMDGKAFWEQGVKNAEGDQRGEISNFRKITDKLFTGYYFDKHSSETRIIEIYR